MKLEIGEEIIIPTSSEPLKNEILDFLRSIVTDSAPLVSGEEGLTAVKIVELGIQSIDKSKVMSFQ